MSTTSTTNPRRKDRGQPGNGGRFTDKDQSAPEVSLLGGFDLTVAEPKDIDERLAGLHGELSGIERARQRAAERLAKLESYEEEHGRQLWNEEPGERKKLAHTIEAAGEATDLTWAKIDLIDAEFRRRGGWTRAFLVSGGHLHSSMECSTCFPTTQFSWMTELSDEPEEAIVAAAGERACTVCYPSAPVDVLRRKSTLLTPDEREAAEAREKRAIKKAERDRIKAEKAITNPDGTELVGYRFSILTLVSAERELTDVLRDIRIVEIKKTQGEVVSHHNPHYEEQLRDAADRIVAAIAHKKGITAEEVLATALPKGIRKAKEWGYE